MILLNGNICTQNNGSASFNRSFEFLIRGNRLYILRNCLQSHQLILHGIVFSPLIHIVCHRVISCIHIIGQLLFCLIIRLIYRRLRTRLSVLRIIPIVYRRLTGQFRLFPIIFA